MLQFFPRQSQIEMLQIIESPEERKEVYPTGFEHRFSEPDRVTLKLVFLGFCFVFLVCVCGYGKVHLCASLSFLITLRCLPCIGPRKCEINVKH